MLDKCCCGYRVVTRQAVFAQHVCNACHSLKGVHNQLVSACFHVQICYFFDKLFITKYCSFFAASTQDVLPRVELGKVLALCSHTHQVVQQEMCDDTEPTERLFQVIRHSADHSFAIVKCCYKLSADDKL